MTESKKRTKKGEKAVATHSAGFVLPAVVPVVTPVTSAVTGTGIAPTPPLSSPQLHTSAPLPAPLPSPPPTAQELLDTASQMIHASLGIPASVLAGVSADTPTPFAIVCSDIHLSSAPPAARIDEPDWLKAMETQMLWLFQQAGAYNVPIVIAGDVFDKAICDSRFIAYVNKIFKQCKVPIYTVAGNHDLPYHSYDNLDESAYGILLGMGSIINVDPTVSWMVNSPVSSSTRCMVTFHDFHWGRAVTDLPAPDPNHINVAVFHKFIYDATTSYFGADPDGLYETQVKNMPHNYRYDFLIFGDNHTPFSKTTPAGATLINCGSFFRRSQNDRDLKPAAYLLKTDGTFETLFVPLDGQAFLQNIDDALVQPSTQDYSELAAFFTDVENGIDNLTVRDSLRKFIIATQPTDNVKDHLSRITGLSFA